MQLLVHFILPQSISLRSYEANLSSRPVTEEELKIGLHFIVNSLKSTLKTLTRISLPPPPPPPNPNQSTCSLSPTFVLSTVIGKYSIYFSFLVRVISFQFSKSLITHQLNLSPPKNKLSQSAKVQTFFVNLASTRDFIQQ